VALRAGKRTAPVVLELAPDARKRLSDATLVEASIDARLLGVRLLTLDATIALVPADVTAAARAVPRGSSGNSRPRSGSVGPRLADAVRNLDEGAKLLAEVQRNRS
jgi:hypothetical protein